MVSILIFYENNLNDSRFIYDMNSTHGVRVNKKSIEKQKHIPLLTGFVFQIAGNLKKY